MAYHVEYTKTALSRLKKMDVGIARAIFSWIKKNIDGCDNPRAHGKALKGNLHGQWHYRIGNYRALCLIEDDHVLALVLTVGHRREIHR